MAAGYAETCQKLPRKASCRGAQVFRAMLFRKGTQPRFSWEPKLHPKRSVARNKDEVRELRSAIAAHLSPRVVGGPGMNSAPLIFIRSPARA
jgi:hypothetical protein